MKENITSLYTCENCHWKAQCQDPSGIICEHYDSLSEMEEEFEEKLLADLKYIEFKHEWEEYREEWEIKN
ncbi:hypothetical protein AALA22_09000 [Anaerovoracaceae bacterium 41-7]